MVGPSPAALLMPYLFGFCDFCDSGSALLWGLMLALGGARGIRSISSRWSLWQPLGHCRSTNTPSPHNQPALARQPALGRCRSNVASRPHHQPRELRLAEDSEPILLTACQPVPQDQFGSPWLEQLIQDMCYTLVLRTLPLSRSGRYFAAGCARGSRISSATGNYPLCMLCCRCIL